MIGYTHLPLNQQKYRNIHPLDTLEFIVDERDIQDRPTLHLIQILCQALDDAGINYCHWKSNTAIARSASGDNDLDLLVSSADGQRFTAILHRLGFKEALVPPVQELPGVLNYYGYDQPSDKFVHVHAHHQLIIGHDMTKNYCLPLERPFLESAQDDPPFKIPSPEFELIVLVIRMVLKHCTWDAMLRREGSLSKTEQEELIDLSMRVNWTKLFDLLAQHLPSIKPALFDHCLYALQPGCSVWTRMKAGRQLQKCLIAHARRPLLMDIALKVWRRGTKMIRRRLFTRLPKKRLAHGGAMLVIVGGDGSGKSTAIGDLHVWLAKYFDTMAIHMGKPTWSWRTYAIRGALKVVSAPGNLLGQIGDRKERKQQPNFQTGLTHTPGLTWLLQQICTAHDRYQTYRMARRFSMNGGLVLCDRYPLAQITLMDGPQVERVFAEGQRNWFVRQFIKAEKKYYQRIYPPELLIVLKLDPEIAVQRKTEEDPDLVRIRGQEIWQTDWAQIPVHVVDASQPRAEVLAELKSLIWSEL